MTDQYVAEIRILPYQFAPEGWAFCDGQQMSISQNTALYSILGEKYGGDGKTYFNLPDLRDRVPLSRGPDLNDGTFYEVGDKGGAATVTLTADELPTHTHAFQVSTARAVERQPVGKYLAAGRGIAMYDVADAAKSTEMDPGMVKDAGDDATHDNLMPYLTVSYCIALQGIFPPRG